MEINDDNYGPVLTDMIQKDWRNLRQIGKKAGISENTIYSWIRMRSAPSLTCLSWMLDTLGYKLEVVKK